MTATTHFLACSGVGQPPLASNGTKAAYLAAAELPHVRAFLHRWTDRESEAVDEIRDAERVVMFGHSRGVKWLCDVARLYNLPIAVLISADGWCYKGNLVIPRNVVRLLTWRQERFHPSGKPIELESAATIWEPHRAPHGTRHKQVDELPDVVAAVHAALVAE